MRERTPVCPENSVRVFISYAWESEEYRNRVKSLATRLIHDGICARLDAWHVKTGQIIPDFMVSESRNADRILIVCSPEYRRKVHAMEDAGEDNRPSGAGYESMLTKAALWTGNRRSSDVEVVLLQGSPEESIPTFLSARDHIDLTKPQLFERNYRELLRRLTGQRERAPQIGNLPDLTPEKIEPLRGTAEADLHIDPPGLLIAAIDRTLPALSRALCRRRPREYEAVNEHLRSLRGHIEQEIAKKNYIPNAAKKVVTPLAADSPGDDPFVRPVHQIIRGLVGRSEGGDSATAQIAAVNRRSRVIRNIVKTLLRNDAPLILLGDPGTGKSLTLQQAAIALTGSELRRVYPAVPLFVRLGEFHQGSHVSAEDVLDYVKASAPPPIRPWIDALDRAGRLVLLFDGMDEMSRQFYTAHTEALSEFASGRRGRTKTLFSCRITDFSPGFVHQRLVLLPFDEPQIAEYLRRYFLARAIAIEGERWKIKRLAKHLLRDTSVVDASNPFTLWLLCFHLGQKKKWPASRTALLEFYLEESFCRKREDRDPQLAFPPLDHAMSAWARLAYAITSRNRGSAIPLSELDPGEGFIRIGRLCGVLAESAESQVPLVRFEHHRLQEYFTARHIRDANPPIDWLDKLDAPRWQETLVNLVLMGGGDEAVAVLSSAISSEIEHAPTADFPPDRELLLADRAELATRIARAAASSQAAARLMPTVVQSVRFLMIHGNPITQMKMMRACIHLPDPQLLSAIRRPLNSPINWLRDQALVLLSASELRGGASLASEIGYDFANGVLLVRIPTYIKAIRVSHQRGAVRSLLIGLVAALADLLVAAAIGAALYKTIAWLPRPDPDPWLTHVFRFIDAPSGAIATAALDVFTAILVLRKAPEYLWAAVIGTTLAVPLLTFAVPELWRTPAEGAYLLLATALVLWLFAAPAITLAVAGFHFTLTAGYFLTTAPFHDKTSRTLFVRGSWDRCGFSWWTGHKATFYPIAYLAGMSLMGLIFSGVGFGIGFLGSLVSPAHREVLGTILTGAMGIAILATLAFFAIAIVATTGIAVCRFIRNRQIRQTQLTAFRRFVRQDLPRLAATAALFVAGLFVAGLVLVLLVWVVMTFDTVIGPAVAAVILLALVAILARQSWSLLQFRFARPYSFGPKSHTNSSWIEFLKSADPLEQDYIIAQTTHETLGLTPGQFLAVFQQAQPLIKSEPALSTYWARRADLEQVLRQERRG